MRFRPAGCSPFHGIKPCRAERQNCEPAPYFIWFLAVLLFVLLIGAMAKIGELRAKNKEKTAIADAVYVIADALLPEEYTNTNDEELWET